MNAELQALLDDLRSTPQDQFQLSQFVRQCRQVAPVTALSDLMAQHGNKLQHELVQLLNNDFEQYISLSASLQGTEQIVDNILSPIFGTRQQLLSCFVSICQDYNDIQALLEEQNKAYQTRKQFVSNLPVSISDPGSDFRIGGIERQARVAIFRNTITFELKRDMQNHLIRLMSSEAAPERHEIASIFRAFSLCGLQELAINCCKNFVVSQMSSSNGLLDIPELLSSQKTFSLASRCSLLDSASFNRFLILIRSFFSGLTQLINNEKSRSVFSTANPAQFHRNYTAYMRLVNFLESLQPGISLDSQVVAITTQFKPEVYFRLRFQAIVMRLESGLLDPLKLCENELSDYLPAVSLKVSALVCNLSYSCFNDDVFIEDLAARFFALCMQIFSRFATYVTGLLETKTESGFFLTFADDIGLISSWIESNLKQHCKDRFLKGHSNSEEVSSLIDQEFRKHAEKLNSFPEVLKQATVKSVVQLCEAALEAVPRIKALYRMSGHKQPDSPLEYVAQVVAPLKDAVSQIHSQRDRDSLGSHAIRIVSASYSKQCSKLLEVMVQTESSLRKFGNTTGSNALANSSMRIAQQLKLDVEEYRRLLKLIANGAPWGIDEAVDEILQIIDKSHTSS